MMWPAIRLAARRLMRAPLYAITVSATLALGIGVTGGLFALVHGVLIRPLPYRDAQQLVEIQHHATRVQLPMTGVSPGLVDHYRAETRSLEQIGAYVERTTTFSDLDEPERIRVASVTPEVFTVLQSPPLLGRLFVPGDYAPGGAGLAVLSHTLWVRRYAADVGIIGRSIEIDRNTYEVVGVAHPDFYFPRPETDGARTSTGLQYLIATFSTG
jgi:hypothetical protein